MGGRGLAAAAQGSWGDVLPRGAEDGTEAATLRWVPRPRPLPGLGNSNPIEEEVDWQGRFQRGGLPILTILSKLLVHWLLLARDILAPFLSSCPRGSGPGYLQIRYSNHYLG